MQGTPCHSTADGNNLCSRVRLDRPAWFESAHTRRLQAVQALHPAGPTLVEERQQPGNLASLLRIQGKKGGLPPAAH